MEIVSTLRKKENIDKLKDAGAKGIIVGSLFSLSFNYSLEDIKEISEICYEKKMDCYLEINALISEGERGLLDAYARFIKELKIKGIYFSDFAVRRVVKKYNIDTELIYDSNTLMSNTPDVMCMLNQGMGVVLARELNFNETKDIVFANQNKVDLQVFGHLRLSYSKRKFLSNYEREIKENLCLENNKKLRIEEETREYSLPIIEDKYGTRIYSDFVYLFPVEMCLYKNLIKRGIVDDMFIDDFQMVIDFIKETKRFNKNNAAFIEQAFYNKYSKIVFSTGYMFEKMNIKKEENEED